MRQHNVPSLHLQFAPATPEQVPSQPHSRLAAQRERRFAEGNSTRHSVILSRFHDRTVVCGKERSTTSHLKVDSIGRSAGRFRPLTYTFLGLAYVVRFENLLLANLTDYCG